jgi:hypothetical protein
VGLCLLSFLNCKQYLSCRKLLSPINCFRPSFIRLFRLVISDHQRLISLVDPETTAPVNELQDVTLNTSDTLDTVGGGASGQHDMLLFGTNRSDTTLLGALSLRLADKEACFTGVRRQVVSGEKGSKEEGCDVQIEALKYKTQVRSESMQLVLLLSVIDCVVFFPDRSFFSAFGSRIRGAGSQLDDWSHCRGGVPRDRRGRGRGARLSL